MMCPVCPGLFPAPTSAIVSSMSPATRQTLRWALALPFFLMPLSLTIDAPDVHGGWHGHVLQAAVLCVLGLFVGRLVAGRGRWEGRLLQVGVGILLAALLGWRLSTSGSELGRHVAVTLAALLGRSPAGLQGGFSPWTTLLCAAVLLVGLLRVRQGRPAPAALALLATPLLVGIATAFPFPGVRHAGPLWIGLAALALGLLRLPDRVAHHAAVGVGTVLGLLVAGAGVLGGVEPGDHPRGAEAPFVLVAACFGAVGTGLLTRSLLLFAERSSIRWTAALGPPLIQLGHGLLGVGLAFGADAVLPLARLLGDGWLALLFPGPRSGASFALPIDVPDSAALAWTLAVGVGGLLATTIERLRRAASLLGLLFGVYAAASAIQSLGLTGSNGLHWLVPAVAALFVAARLPAFLDAADPGTLGLSAVPALVLAAPVLLHHAVAAWTCREPPLGWVAVPALLIAALPLLPTFRRSSARPAAPWWRLWIVLLFGVARVLPIFTAVALGVEPGPAALVLTLSPVVWWLLRRLRVPAAGPVAAWWVFYACFTIVMEYKAGPARKECEEIVASTTARVVLDRFRASDTGGVSREFATAEPYDVLPDPEAGALLVSWKRIGRQGGFLTAIDPSRPELRTLLPTKRPDGGPFWPERLERDPLTGRTWLQMLGIGAYAMWEVDVDRPFADGPPGLRITRTVPITWEPGHPAIDEARRRLVLSYVPNRDATNPLVETISLETDQRTHTPKSRPRLEMADFITADPRTRRYIVPAFFDHIRFALVEVDGDTMAVRRWRETAFPTVGLAADGLEPQLFATNVVGGKVAVIDMASLSARQVLSAGAFPRDLVWDRARRRLWVANYGDGTVMDWDLRGPVAQPGGRHAVGPLLRGLGLNPGTGQVFAASACGVFEIPGGPP